MRRKRGRLIKVHISVVRPTHHGAVLETQRFGLHGQDKNGGRSGGGQDPAASHKQAAHTDLQQARVQTGSSSLPPGTGLPVELMCRAVHRAHLSCPT